MIYFSGIIASLIAKRLNSKLGLKVSAKFIFFVAIYYILPFIKNIQFEENVLKSFIEKCKP